MKIRAITALWAVLLAVGAVIFMSPSVARADAQRAHEQFLAGNQAYEAGEFQMAVDAYRRALDEGLVNSRLYYNYGNALYRLNRLGPAILYYERALKLTPHDDDIRHNLRFANARIVDKPSEPASNALTRFLWKVHAGYSLNQGLWASLALFSLIFLFAGLRTYLPNWKALWTMALVACLLAIVSFVPSLTYRIYVTEAARHAVVLEPTLNLYSGPGRNYELLSKIHEGTKVEVTSAKDDWALIKLSNGLGGYVTLDALGRI